MCGQLAPTCRLLHGEQQGDDDLQSAAGQLPFVMKAACQALKKQPKRAIKDACAALPRELNSSQLGAIKLACQRTLTLWQGPPGSGKTYTLACCIATILHLTAGTNARMLACAGSNVAVDNLVEALLRRSIKVVRFGQPARISAEGIAGCVGRKAPAGCVNFVLCSAIASLSHTLFRHLACTGTSRGVLAYTTREQCSTFLCMKAAHSKVLGGDRDELRRMLHDLWAELLHATPTSAGVVAASKRKQAAALCGPAQANMYEAAQAAEASATAAVLDEAQVVASTCVSSAESRLEERTFDICVIDEASQVTEPDVLVALTKVRFTWIVALAYVAIVRVHIASKKRWYLRATEWTSHHV
jgi:hypothetical protein